MAQGRRKGRNQFVVPVVGGVVVVALLLVVGGVMGLRAVLARRPEPTPPAKKAIKMTTAPAFDPTAPVLASAAPPAPVPVSRPATDQVVPVLMYHHIMPKPNNSIAITPAFFDQQMKWLHDHDYHPISMAQFNDFIRTGKRLPPRPLLITFDDDRMNQLTYGVPILRKYGFTATFFVVKKWIDSPSKSFMHPAQLRKLAALGYDIESHTNAHGTIRKSKSEDYAGMKKRLWGETYGMRMWLSSLIGKPVTALAYPGGLIDKYSPVLAHESGYLSAFTTDNGNVRYGKTSPYLVYRYNTGARGLLFSSFVRIFDRTQKAVATPPAYPAKP